jgi:hypothetical protein
LKILIVLLVTAIIGITLATATTNDKLPTKEEVTNFISGESNSTASEILDKVKEDHPTWKADLYYQGNEEAIALYYIYDNEKGYGSVYFKDGEIVSPSSLGGYTLKESYTGELEESNNTTDENTSTQPEEDSKIVKDDETEKNSNNTYEAFTKALDSYDGKTDCTSMGCASSLSDYFKELGWSSDVRYCVAVNTSDEGTVYVVLGA